VDQSVEVEVAVSRPARPACAFDAPQARSVAEETFLLVASHNLQGDGCGAFTPVESSMEAPTLIVREPGCRDAKPVPGCRATARLSCRDGIHGVAWWAKWL
jgi:hypothetical protein